MVALFSFLFCWLHSFSTVDGNSLQRRTRNSRAEKRVGDYYNGRGDAADKKESLSRADTKVKGQPPETSFLRPSPCTILTP